MIDTNRPELRDKERLDFGSDFMVTGRSMLMFELHRDEEE
jgi:glycogen operon protein